MLDLLGAGLDTARIARENGLPHVPQLSAQGQAALMGHAFPGNVRELENVLQRAVALSSGGTLSPEDLGLMAPPASTPDTLNALSTELDVPAPPQPSVPLTAPLSVDAPLPGDLVAHLDQIERDILVRALEQHRLNRTAAGASLGLSLRQIRYRMARLGVHVGEQGVTLGAHFDPDNAGDGEPDGESA
mgnify:FL=1